MVLGVHVGRHSENVQNCVVVSVKIKVIHLKNTMLLNYLVLLALYPHYVNLDVFHELLLVFVL